MTYTLDVWFFPENRSARMPQAVSSHSDLDALLARLVEREQPHPAQIVARERPTVGPRNQPDTLIKLAVAGTGKVGALLFVSPESWAEPAEGDTSTGIYVTRAETAAPDAPTLFIDKATGTPFPADAVLPVERIHEALEEFRQTGERPSCVDWQESAVY